MNNLRFFLLACLIALPTCLLAQKHTDLSANIVFPAQDGYEVAVGDTLKILMSIKNLGPEDILPTDSLMYKIEGFPVTSAAWDSIPAGDSVIINVLNYINDGSDSTDMTHTFCFYLKYDLYQTIDDPNPENDTTCISFIVKSSQTGIAGTKQNDFTPKISLFPNPAKDIVHLKYDNIQIESLQLRALSGRLIKTFPEQGKTLDISGLPAGTYFLQIRTKQGKEQAKKVLIK